MRRRQQGWCLIEVMVAVMATGVLAGVIGMSLHQHSEQRRAMDGYGAGLRGLRAATTLLSDDVRAGRPLSAWHLEGHRLYRNDRRVAEHVAWYTVQTDQQPAIIHIQPQSPTDGSVNKTRALVVHVAKRSGGAR